ncbi:DMT family transporter [Cohaesibacter gelatinilyticus]|uniref:Permease of the drug/metabolite transporter (DMT) superfamily n=1 Tax=Cohaesibacter gelatinilyticus TaxID=372072 RepID=A0A285PHQ9_9HYPH|nr:EamA family transporter [Cohaesibacter gelatinilyticus]SNZ20777.1 Permease of the drug/metabolite transporter (DMT) superfamily [Cohaesibacter gelatinilyticus]HAT85237.1 EamA family transporter [Hyphomicrobiales bacterium]
MSKQLVATAIGFAAILMWALLALFTAASGTMPPFQLTAITFAIGGGLGAISWLFRSGAMKTLKQPWPVWVLGVVGLFGYHFLYYTALRLAPPVEAGLIAYLWPLLIVVLSALLPGENLRWYHVAGSILGLIGTVLIVTKGKGVSIDWRYGHGYLAAFICAFTWSGYSVLSRRFAAVPTDIVVGFCLVTAMLSTGAHLVFENTIWPSDFSQWLAILGLGLLPVGAAFYVWDYGVKHGDIQVLGAASYAAPLLSTTILILAGFAEFSWAIGGAALLVTSGAVLASKDLIFKPKSS